MIVLSDENKFRTKEQLYLAVRDKEGRLYTDVQVKRLPFIDAEHRHYSEWLLRTESCRRLLTYLNAKWQPAATKVLDIGCGNGWMSHRLHAAGFNVTGLDLNMNELSQAERVFDNSDTLRWVYADIFDKTLSIDRYHVVVLAAACQYFSSIGALTERLLQFMEPGGEIHLVDSKFYSGLQLPAARERTRAYYDQLGFSEMSDYYFHHNLNDLRKMGYKRQYPRAVSLAGSGRGLEWWRLTR